jgi:tetratricopeptide (TPR) repeat protein
MQVFARLCEIVGEGEMHRLGVFALATFLCACAATTPHFEGSAASGDGLDAAVAALQSGRPGDARAALAPGLRAEPQNGYLHLLNGLTYELEEHSPQSLDLASVGYDAATRFVPGFYWAHYHEGALALARQQYADAAEQFAAAILSDPAQAQAFLGLAVSAYYAGDLDVAARAAGRALALEPNDPYALRAAAFVAAGAGNRQVLDRLVSAAHATPAGAAGLDRQRSRLDQLMRTAYETEPGPAGDAGPGAAVEASPHQVMIEVTLLLSQNARANHTGVNLLDGLTLQFSGARLTTDNHSSPGADSKTVATTSALAIPQISYSLNLFNTRDDYYEVIARPSLVASLGETSQFFIGRTVTIGVSGINLGSLQPVDVGTSVQVTPIEITSRTAKFKVDTGRSFFSPDTSGTFQQALTTFKQTVAATVEVDFGKTLILSGLYEGVNIGASSKVPGLGDIPVVDLAFNNRVQTTRQDAALVLVTPRIAGMINTGTREFRGETLSRVLDLWNTLVEPTGGLDAVLGTLRAKGRPYHPLLGDVRLPSAGDQTILGPTLTDTVARLR